MGLIQGLEVDGRNIGGDIPTSADSPCSALDCGGQELKTIRPFIR